MGGWTLTHGLLSHSDICLHRVFQMFPAWLLLILSRAKGLRTCLCSQPSAGARPLGPIKCVYLRPHADSNLATRLNHAANVIICLWERRVIFDTGQVLWPSKSTNGRICTVNSYPKDIMSLCYICYISSTKKHLKQSIKHDNQQNAVWSFRPTWLYSLLISVHNNVLSFV